jgi:purine-binding chemotaxis protein CheW
MLVTGGLRFALDARRVSAVLPEQTPVTRYPRQPDFVLGAVEAMGRKSLVMRLDRVVFEADRGGDRRVVLLDGGRWGIACETVEGEAVWPDASIRWREAPGERPWLAGTQRAERVAVLDVDMLRRVFQRA